MKLTGAFSAQSSVLPMAVFFAVTATQTASAQAHLMCSQNFDTDVNAIWVVRECPLLDRQVENNLC